MSGQQDQEISREERFDLSGPLNTSSAACGQFSSFDIDGGDGKVETGRNATHQRWRLGMPWFNGPQTPSFFRGNGEELHYVGGLMNAEISPREHFGGDSHVPPPKSIKNGTRNLRSPQHFSRETIENFDSSEWTPVDSSYGAAFPVCGWIPKPVRRMIEFSLIAGMVIGFVWILVYTSIQVTNARKDSLESNATFFQNGQMIPVDDDFYVEVTNDDFQDTSEYGDDQGDWDDNLADAYTEADDFAYNGGR